MSKPMIASHGAWDANSPAPTPDQNQSASQVCIPNIDTAGRRQRLIAGVVPLVIGLGLLGGLLALHASPLWRLPLLFMFWGAAIGFFQWRDRT